MFLGNKGWIEPSKVQQYQKIVKIGLDRQADKCIRGRGYPIEEIREHAACDAVKRCSASVCDRCFDCELIGTVEIERDAFNLCRLS